MQAVTVADKSGIEPSLWRLFRDLGITHLLVISGLHVGMVAGVGLGLGMLLRRVCGSVGPLSVLQSLLAFVPAALYAALADFSLPTLRALIMLAVFLLTTHARRSGSGWQRLLTAAVVVLLINPVATIASGFWLSFGAVAALLWFSACRVQSCAEPLQRKPLWRSDGRWQQMLGVHAYMGLVMLPMGAAFFGGASVVAMFANLLMIPLIGLVVVPLALLGVLAHLAGWEFAETLWQMAAWPLATVLPIIKVSLADNPDLAFLPLHGTTLSIALALVSVVVLIAMRGAARLLVGLLVLPLLVPIATATPEHAGPHTTMTLLDVGQGTAVVIVSGKKALLYDTGGGDPEGANAAARVVLPYLRTQGIARLDTLIISHGDNDHSAGAATVLNVLDVHRLRYGGGWDAGGKGLPCAVGQAWVWSGRARFQVLSTGVSASTGSNNGSCVVLADIDGFRVLLAGDIEQSQERELVAYWRQALDVDALLVPHHGSGTSSSHVLLKTTSPRFALISAGYANAFGHPKHSVVSRLEHHSARTLNTAREGAVEIHLHEGKVLAIERYRRGWRPFWW